MHRNNQHILITADVDKSLVIEMTAKGFIIDVIPFIQTQAIKSNEVQKQIENISRLNTTLVFTSANAVKVVSEYVLNDKPNWQIYCIGNTTRILIEKLFGKASVKATADDATDLAERMITDKKSINEVYFFCGDKRRNELPALLKKNNIIINEIEVYTTTILHHKVGRDYDAILFFSPSTVDGFFKNNQIQEKIILFAIGNTTADEIKKFSKNDIIISNKPGKQDLIEKAIKYFEDCS